MYIFLDKRDFKSYVIMYILFMQSHECLIRDV